MFDDKLADALLARWADHVRGGLRVELGYRMGSVESVWHRSRGRAADDWPQEVVEVEAAVLALPQEFRNLVFDHYVRGMGVTSIAGVEGVTRKVIGVRLTRVREWVAGWMARSRAA